MHECVHVCVKKHIFHGQWIVLTPANCYTNNANNKCTDKSINYLLQIQKVRFARLKNDAFVVFLSSILIKNYFILCTLAEHFGLYFKTIFLKLYQHHVPIFGRHYILIEILEVYHCIKSRARLDLIMIFFLHLSSFFDIIFYTVLSFLISFKF